MGRRDKKATREASEALRWLAEGLNDIAKRRSLSTSDLSQITGLDRQIIEALLNRQLDVELSTIDQLMRTLDVNAEELFGGFGRTSRKQLRWETPIPAALGLLDSMNDYLGFAVSAFT